MTTLTDIINAWIVKRRKIRVKLAVDTLIKHHLQDDPDCTQRTVITAPNCVFNDRPVGDMTIAVQPGNPPAFINSDRLESIAERLISQDDEPTWLINGGNYSRRMNYWRDKCIHEANAIRALIKDAQ